MIVPVGTEWEKFEYRLSEMSVDEAKKQDGKLNINHISSILIADSAAMGREEGSRSVWFAEWAFE